MKKATKIVVTSCILANSVLAIKHNPQGQLKNTEFVELQQQIVRKTDQQFEEIFVEVENQLKHPNGNVLMAKKSEEKVDNKDQKNFMDVLKKGEARSLNKVAQEENAI